MMTKFRSGMVAGAAAILVMAIPAMAQPNAHQMALDHLAQCHTTQVETIAHLNAMARGAHNAREHSRALARLAECRDYLTAAIAHLNAMAAEMHH
jgi:hypothetical protein